MTAGANEKRYIGSVLHAGNLRAGQWPARGEPVRGAPGAERGNPSCAAVAPACPCARYTLWQRCKHTARGQVRRRARRRRRRRPRERRPRARLADYGPYTATLPLKHSKESLSLPQRACTGPICRSPAVPARGAPPAARSARTQSWHSLLPHTRRPHAPGPAAGRGSWRRCTRPLPAGRCATAGAPGGQCVAHYEAARSSAGRGQRRRVACVLRGAFAECVQRHSGPHRATSGDAPRRDRWRARGTAHWAPGGYLRAARGRLPSPPPSCRSQIPALAPYVQ